MIPVRAREDGRAGRLLEGIDPFKELQKRHGADTSAARIKPNHILIGFASSYFDWVCVAAGGVRGGHAPAGPQRTPGSGAISVRPSAHGYACKQ